MFGRLHVGSAAALSAYALCAKQGRTGKGNVMTLWTIVIVLALLWLLGMPTSYTLSGLIHILLVVALIVVLVRVIQGRRLTR